MEKIDKRKFCNPHGFLVQEERYIRVLEERIKHLESKLKNHGVIGYAIERSELFICSFCKSDQTYLSEAGHVRTCLKCDKTARVN